MDKTKILEEYTSSYMYSVKRILSLQENNVEIEDYNVFISNLEYYYNYLNENEKILPINVSSIGILLFDSFDNIKKQLLNKNMSNEEDFEVLKREINKSLKGIDMNAITNTSKRSMEVDTNDEPDDEINFNSNNDIKHYIISLIDSNSYPYSDYMEKLFLNLEYDSVFKIRKTKFNSKLKYSKKRFLYILNSLNSLFDEVYNIFSKKGEFNFTLVNSYLFYDDSQTRSFFVDFLCCDNGKPNRYNCSTYSNDSCQTLLWEFYLGLNKLKDFCIINYKNFNNYNHRGERFGDYSLEEQFKLVHSMSQELSEKSIYIILSIRDLSFAQIVENKNLINDINTMIDEIKEKSINFCVRKQELLQSNKDIIDEFTKNIEDYKRRFKDYTLENLMNFEIIQNSRIDLLAFDLKYNDIQCKVKISQLNLKLFSYVYLEKKILAKDRLFRVEDFDRIFLTVQDYCYNQNKNNQ